MCRILLVDDDADLRELYSELLECMGYVVLCACDGEAALELARQWQPDLVLTDWCMPRMDGVELSRRLRQDEALWHIPILLQSSMPDPRAPEVDAFLAKGCTCQELEVVLARVLESTREPPPSVSGGRLPGEAWETSPMPESAALRSR